MLLIQGVFRSGTTALFRALRQDERLDCFYEPLCIRTFRGTSTTPIQGGPATLNHRSTKNIFHSSKKPACPSMRSPQHGRSILGRMRRQRLCRPT